MRKIKATSNFARMGWAIALGCGALVGCAGDDKFPDGGHPTGGAPDEPCGGFLGLACAAGKFCHHEEGNCGLGDTLGTCVPIPTSCTQECTEVCGCDGRYYCNACMAHLAGVDDSLGTACEGKPPTAE